MSHRIIGISHSSNGDLTRFVQFQITRLAALHSNIDFETANQANEALLAHTDPAKHNRFPLYIYTKHDVYVTTLYGKHDDARVSAWINSLGI